MNRLAVIVLTYNSKKVTLDCLESIFSKKWQTPFSIWLVDNNSQDQTIEAVRDKFPEVKIIASKKNLGFAGGNNLALKKTFKNYPFLLLLNNDTLVKEKSLDKLVEFFEDSPYSIATCKLEYPGGAFQANVGRLPVFPYIFIWLSGVDDLFRKLFGLPSYQERNERFYQGDKDVGWVSGAVMLIKAEVLKKIGFLDDKIFMYGEDVDFCWRAKKADFKVGFTDRTSIVHIGGASFEQPKYNQWLGEFRGLIYLYEKNYGELSSIILKIFIYFFVFLRIIAFALIGKKDYAKTYFKVFKNL